MDNNDCLGFCINHIDDIVIFSNDITEHIKHIEKVLNALTSVDLTINENKCIFFAKTLPVLGFILEIGGLRLNLKKVCNMLEKEIAKLYWHCKLLSQIHF